MTIDNDILTTLTSFAVSVFRERAIGGSRGEPWRHLLFASDPLLQEAYSRLAFEPLTGLSEVVERVLAQPDLVGLGHRDNQLDPMVLHAGGGSRVSPSALVAGLFSAAFLQMFYLRLPDDESTFVRTVLAGFDELRRAARGERVRGHAVTGIAGITLPDNAQVSTPWGIVRPAPPVTSAQTFVPVFQPVTTCILAESRLVTVKFDRAPQPQHSFDQSELTPDRSRVLLPVASALASPQTMEPAVPVVTWSTLLLPFLGGLSYMQPVLPARLKPVVDMGGQISTFEEWARIVDTSHSPGVDIAARRLASAVAYRLDPSDALIDAVMVWENLVGTPSEVTFRVTAALAKALEPNRQKRRELRKTLANIYNVRSRVVHGVAVEHSEIADAAKAAIDVAVRVLRLFYRRGPEWLALGSTERADALLLEEP